MQKTCEQCRQKFEVTDDDIKFYEKVSPEFGGRKFLVPAPTLCADCRMQRRLGFRNERFLYHRKCDFTGRQIVSAYAPDSPYKTYQSDEWFSDKWDPLSYGRDFDFNRPFFEQFWELKKSVPRMALVTSPDAEAYNCMYVNFSGHSKNCYMTFDSDYNEDSYYTKVLKHSKFCVDCSFVHHCELCYECVDCYASYNLRFSRNCSNCSDSAFLKNCVGCRNCFFCSNLTQKEYCIRNKKYSREEYEKMLSSFNQSSYEDVRPTAGEFPSFCLAFPQKFAQSLKSEDSTGNYLFNVQRCHQCYDVADAQDVRYCDSLYKAKDCCDVSSFGENVEMSYECGTLGIDSYGILFGFGIVISSSNLLYCDECRTSKHCFGCAGLKKNQYCVFNKQYSKDQYDALVTRIIEHMRKTGEWGEHYPLRHSAFGYNESVAQEYFPLGKEDVAARGWNWREEESQSQQYLGPKVLIPDSIEEVDESICQNILQCEVTGKPYKIIPQELKLYRQLHVPLPRKCPDQRHKERLALRNPRKLWSRQCAKCKKDIQTSYAPDRSEIVYCNDCYLQTVY